MLGKKKLVNLIELIVQALLLISTFVIQSIEIVSHSYNSTSVSKMSIIAFGAINNMNFLVFIPIILMFVNAVLCLVSIFGNSTDKDGKMHIAIPIANLIYGLWLINAISADVNSAYKAFWIICLIIISVLAILKRTSFVIPKEDNTSQQVIIQETSTADELKKYKDLLDSGVITQEEFDEKKKQLLSL